MTLTTFSSAEERDSAERENSVSVSTSADSSTHPNFSHFLLEGVSLQTQKQPFFVIKINKKYHNPVLRK
jgi:hypothetical protein